MKSVLFHCKDTVRNSNLQICQLGTSINNKMEHFLVIVKKKRNNEMKQRKLMQIIMQNTLTGPQIDV